MAEAVAIFKVAGASSNIAKGLWDVGAALNDAGSHIRQLATSVECTSSVLMQLGQVMELEKDVVHPDDRKMAGRLLEYCSHLMAKLQRLLDRLLPLILEKGRLHLWSRLQVVFKKSCLGTYCQTLESLKSSLNLLVSTMNYRAAAERGASSETTAVLLARLEDIVQKSSDAAPSLKTLILDSSRETPLLPDPTAGFRLLGSSNNAITDPTVEEPQVDFDDTVSISDTIDLTSEGESGSITPGRSSIVRVDDEGDVTTDEIIEAQTSLCIVKVLEHETGQIARDAINNPHVGRTTQRQRVAWICVSRSEYLAAKVLLDQKDVRSISRKPKELFYTTGLMGSTPVVLVYYPLVPFKEASSEARQELIQLLRERFGGVEVLIMVSEGLYSSAESRRGLGPGCVVTGNWRLYSSDSQDRWPLHFKQVAVEITHQLLLGELDDSDAQSRLENLSGGYFSRPERLTVEDKTPREGGSVRLYTRPINLNWDEIDPHNKGQQSSDVVFAIRNDSGLALEYPTLVICGLSRLLEEVSDSEVTTAYDGFAIGQAAIVAKFIASMF